MQLVCKSLVFELLYGSDKSLPEDFNTIGIKKLILKHAQDIDNFC